MAGRCTGSLKANFYAPAVAEIPWGEPAPPPAAEVTAQVCTHQEARGIIQEAAKSAHKAPFQKGGVFWGQLIRFVCDSRRAETLPCCGREGLKEEQARVPQQGLEVPSIRDSGGLQSTATEIH